jgi:hypothetical protein
MSAGDVSENVRRHQGAPAAAEAAAMPLITGRPQQHPAMEMAAMSLSVREQHELRSSGTSSRVRTRSVLALGADGQEAGADPQLQVVRGLGSPPHSRRARLLRDPDDRPDT